MSFKQFLKGCSTILTIIPTDFPTQWVVNLTPRIALRVANFPARGVNKGYRTITCIHEQIRGASAIPDRISGRRHQLGMASAVIVYKSHESLGYEQVIATKLSTRRCAARAVGNVDVVFCCSGEGYHSFYCKAPGQAVVAEYPPNVKAFWLLDRLAARVAQRDESCDECRAAFSN